MTRHLAIDAGQTGIRTRVIDDGIRAPEGELPGILTSQPLMPQLAAVIRGASSSRVDVVSIGSTGLIAEQTDPAGLRMLVADLGVTQVLMAHDSVTSYLGALGDQRGAVVAAGTGVVTLAVGAHDVARVDGWGNLIGDAGSGYWIGRAALDAVMRDHDGRGAATALTAVVTADFPDIEQAYIELQADPGRVRRIAGYARAVAELAAEGDPVASTICAGAAHELAHSISAALMRVGEADRPDPVVCGMGGVLRADVIAGPFAAELRRRWERVDIRTPLGSGIDGAALLPAVAADSALFGLIARA
ncbi:MAG TPA: BadF/BadG/BcrA/BcrD ATPase family protein [Pseudolysinimonas sp.]|nr:BadF/BadG/BcrA/BcrD ATPase family protein [Pseudolysinimonas sp.]